MYWSCRGFVVVAMCLPALLAQASTSFGHYTEPETPCWEERDAGVGQVDVTAPSRGMATDDRFWRDLNAVPDGWVDSVLELYGAGAGDDALAASHVLLGMYPDNSALHFLHGSLLSELGHPHEAIDAFRRVTELAPADGDAWGRLGSELLRIGEMMEAGIATEKALSLDPNDADDWTFNLGHIALLEGDPDLAHGCYRKAVALIRSASGLEHALAGFDALIANGWAADALIAERDWVARAFEALVRYEESVTGGSYSSVVRGQLLRGEPVSHHPTRTTIADSAIEMLSVLDLRADEAAARWPGEDAGALPEVFVLPKWVLDD